MRVRASLLSVVLLALLAACATPFRADVARFQQLPAPQGQTFVIQPREAAKQGSLEFESYAQLVRQQLQAQGYQPSASPQAATLVVTLDYGVSDGREKVVTRPGYGGFYGGYSRFGYWPYSRYPFYHGGFYDPFWGSPFGYPEVYSYTIYNSYLDMQIKQAGSNQNVFEGRAEATSRSDDLTRLVPNLVQAMFTNFPGRSGETVRVKIDQKSQQASAY